MSLFPRCCIWVFFFFSFWSGAFFLGSSSPSASLSTFIVWSLYNSISEASKHHQSFVSPALGFGEESLQSLSEVSPWCSAASRLSVGSTVAPRCTLSIPTNGKKKFVSLPTKAVISFSCFPFSCHRLSAPIFSPFLQETNVSLFKIRP